MARTYPELVEEWDRKITGHYSIQAQRLMRREDSVEDRRTALRCWREATDLADEILTELKAWKEQAEGYQASHALLRERFDLVCRDGLETSQRLAWMEENARRMQRYLEEQATCFECGRFDTCEEGCNAHTWNDFEAIVGARQALAGFAL